MISTQFGELKQSLWISAIRAAVIEPIKAMSPIIGRKGIWEIELFSPPPMLSHQNIMRVLMIALHLVARMSSMPLHRFVARFLFLLCGLSLRPLPLKFQLTTAASTHTLFFIFSTFISIKLIDCQKLFTSIATLETIRELLPGRMSSPKLNSLLVLGVMLTIFCSLFLWIGGALLPALCIDTLNAEIHMTVGHGDVFMKGIQREIAQARLTTFGRGIHRASLSLHPMLASAGGRINRHFGSYPSRQSIYFTASRRALP